MILVKILLTGLVGVTLCLANISGIVSDSAGVGIAGVIIKLEKGGQLDTTESNGHFMLTISTTGANRESNQTQLNKQYAKIHSGLLFVEVEKKTTVGITTFNLNGKALSTVLKTFDAGRHSVSIPYQGAGIYLYKVKLGEKVFVLKNNSVNGVSSEVAVSSRISSSKPLAKLAMNTTSLDDIMIASKNGYLIYRVVVKNLDTSGIVVPLVGSFGSVTDADGNVYQTIKIGDQEWMAENLRVSHYRNGDSIPYITDNILWSCSSSTADWNTHISGARCDFQNIKVNGLIFGYLYNWYAVSDSRGIAPTGWHVPSQTEFKTLINYLGGKDVAGGELKERGLSHWQSPNTGADNSSSFTILPSGARGWHGSFWDNGDNEMGNTDVGSFWTSTLVTSTSASVIGVLGNSAAVIMVPDDETNLNAEPLQDGLSVRCIKD